MLAEPIGGDLGVGAAGTGTVFAVALAAFAVAVLSAGSVADRRGARLLLVLAAVAGAGGLLLAASVPALPAVLVGVGVCFGAANGIGYSAALHVAGTTWPQRRGLAIGIVLSAYALGAVVAAPILSAAVGPFGWQATLAGLAVVVGVLVAVGAALVPGRAATARPGRNAPPSVAIADVALLWVVFGACSAPTLFTFAHAADAARARGASLTAAAVAVAVLSAGNLAGRLAGGWTADRLGSVNGLLAVAAIKTAGYVLLAAVAGAGIVVPVFFVLGAAYGAVSALSPAATADLVGSERLAGTYGKVFSAWGVAGLTAPAAGGWLVESTASYETAFLAGAVAAALAVAGALMLRRAERQADPHPSGGH